MCTANFLLNKPFHFVYHVADSPAGVLVGFLQVFEGDGFVDDALVLILAPEGNGVNDL